MIRLSRWRNVNAMRMRHKRAWCLPFGVACLCFCFVGCDEPAANITPDTLVHAAWDDYRLGDFAAARKEFQAAMERAPRESATRLAALYGLATTWNLRRPNENVARAGRLYRQVIEISPTNELAVWSWLALARMKSLPVDGESCDLRQQVEAYQQVIDRFPFHQAGEEAFLFQQAARLEQPDKARARAVLAALEGFVRTHPKSPWRNTAYALQGHCCTILGLGDKRLEAAFQAWRAVEIDPANPIQDLSWTYWQLATIAEFDAGDFATAREYYRKLIADYPTEQRVFLAKQELQRMDDLEAQLRQEAKTR